MMNTLTTLRSELQTQRNNCDGNDLFSDGVRTGLASAMELVDELIDTIAAEDTARDTASNPHQFKGRTDRWCELCNQPDRASIHRYLG